MVALENKKVLVLGLGLSGVAASELLRSKGANVLALDTADNPQLRQDAEVLRRQGVVVELGAQTVPAGHFDLAVISPGVPSQNPIFATLREAKVPCIGEFELGYQHSLCLNVSITGTNGKTTTTELVERLLRQHQVKTLAAGNIGTPVCRIVEKTRELDFLTLEVSSFQLETIEYFRPAIAVLTNITPDHLDRYPNMADYARAKARIFQNQQAFDWAIVQSEALAYLRSLKVEIPSKVITYSSNNRRADLFLERGMIMGRMDGWSGPLLNMDQCRIFGPHNAENLMAALAVGKILRIPLESMVETLTTYAPAPHRCELVAEVNGVKYVNDSKATNVDALQKALLSMPFVRAGDPNVWLIAGGKDKGFEYHDVGPLLSQRVKGALLIGETRDKIRAAWSLFTPCTQMDSLLEAVSEAAKHAAAGDVILLSPACSSFDQFQNYQHRGEVFRQAVMNLKGAGKGVNPAEREEQPNRLTEVTKLK
ncbi:MAG: UDP-N-acetylmuramoylalanine--D-glutamate ligase [Verrucomicrobiales bacterium]|nr:UDP-N-acetylmuramoylalanine--D-glutamate ligase [Verrucomicrobiales bacterium]